MRLEKKPNEKSLKNEILKVDFLKGRDGEVVI
jgi:hypothetical protein